MRFIHTSDWHLGRAFHGARLIEDQSFVLDQLVRLVKDAEVDALLVSGDVYDRSVPPVEAVELLDDVLNRIVRGLDVPVFMIAGNHDSPERISFASDFLREQGLHVFGTLSDIGVVQLRDRHGPIEVIGIPYADPAQVREAGLGDDVRDHDAAMEALVGEYNKRRKADRVVLLAHAFVSGGKESESERRLSVGGTGEVGGVRFKGFTYVALGHLHRPQAVGGPGLSYSGSILKYSFSEAGDRKGARVVDVGSEGELKVEFIELKPRHDLRCIEGRFNDLLEARDDAESREAYLEITLTDRGPILDAMERLRKVYPNVLNIRRPAIELDEGRAVETVDPRKVDRAELFATFFEQVTGKKPTKKEMKAFSSILSEVDRETGAGR
jgi:exonuclease SbcD